MRYAVSRKEECLKYFISSDPPVLHRRRRRRRMIQQKFVSLYYHKGLSPTRLSAIRRTPVSVT